MKGLAPIVQTWHESMHAVLAQRVLHRLGEPCRSCGEAKPCLRRGWMVLHPWYAGEKTIQIACEQLCAAARPVRSSPVPLAAGKGSCFLIAEYSLAERNLHLPAAGIRSLFEQAGSHRQQWTAFMRCGGLEAALQCAKVEIVRRVSAGCGLLTVALCRDKTVSACEGRFDGECTEG